MSCGACLAVYTFANPWIQQLSVSPKAVLPRTCPVPPRHPDPRGAPWRAPLGRKQRRAKGGQRRTQANPVKEAFWGETWGMIIYNYI